MAVTAFADSPRNGALGDRPYAIIDWAGPSSYTQITAQTSNSGTCITTGGQAITPAAFGLVAPIEGIFCVGHSTSGRYGVRAFQKTSYNQGQGNGTWLLQWYTVSDGAEVSGSTPLDKELVRLVAFGPY